jgi:hypothetical protein
MIRSLIPFEPDVESGGQIRKVENCYLNVINCSCIIIFQCKLYVKNRACIPHENARKPSMALETFFYNTIGEFTLQTAKEYGWCSSPAIFSKGAPRPGLEPGT